MKPTKAEQAMYDLAVSRAERRYKKWGWRRSHMKSEYRAELERLRARSKQGAAQRSDSGAFLSRHRRTSDTV